MYLTDTLDSPYAKPPSPPYYLKVLADQHKHALEVKDKKSVIVCLGNPPYDRHEAVGETGGETGRVNKARTGGWVRWGEYEESTRGKGKRLVTGRPIFEDFTQPAKDAGHGGDIKNLYNLYAYFLRWGLWKVFECKTGEKTGHQGVISFITAASYLRGDAFVGVREMLRRLCHEVWIIDVGGEGRGTRQDDNVFNIQTPVAICIALSKGAKDRNKPAAIKYARIRGTREEKLAKLAHVASFRHLTWKPCPTDWHAPLRPKGTGRYFGYPRLTDLMPWQTSGVQVKRSWPIAPSVDCLRRRWKALMLASDRTPLFKESRDRKITDTYPGLPGVAPAPDEDRSIAALPRQTPMPPVQRYAFRSFDRQWIIADNRIGDYMRPYLWSTASNPRQLFFASLLYETLGSGPGITCAASVPDMHYFCNRGAKDVLPLYRDKAAREPNILPGLLRTWAARLNHPLTPELFAGYVYGLLAHSQFR